MDRKKLINGLWLMLVTLVSGVVGLKLRLGADLRQLLLLLGSELIFTLISATKLPKRWKGGLYGLDVALYAIVFLMLGAAKPAEKLVPWLEEAQTITVTWQTEAGSRSVTLDAEEREELLRLIWTAEYQIDTAVPSVPLQTGYILSTDVDPARLGRKATAGFSDDFIALYPDIALPFAYWSTPRDDISAFLAGLFA